MKLYKEDKYGLLMIAIGVILVFLGAYWTPLALIGVILILLGSLLWDPFGVFF